MKSSLEMKIGRNKGARKVAKQNIRREICTK